MPLNMLALLAPALVAQASSGAIPVDALLYSTMPSTAVHRPEMAMDGDAKSSFRSVYGMEEGDSFTVLLSRPIAMRSIRISTGNGGDDVLTNGFVETSADGTTYVKAAAFKADGVAEVQSIHGAIAAIRIRMNPHEAASHLQIREIGIDTDVLIAHVQQGPPRGFVDVSAAPDLADWAARAEKKMESFWPDTAALLYSDGFITPNAVHVIYRTGPDVTPVAATGGGVMTVNTAWCHQHPDDTGLVVHEAAHVVQSGGSPGWLIEAVADYIRWIKFEPANFTYNINPQRATPHDPYRTGAAFLAWCELHFDSKLVTKLNDATRFGRYNDGLFEKYCGKSIDALWKEFIAAYQADKPNLLTKPVPAAMRPRDLPSVTGATASVALPLEKVGVYADGATFGESGGFDDGGAAYSGALLKSSLTTRGVTFQLGAAGSPSIMSAQGQMVKLDGHAHKSLWILAASVDGGQRDQTLSVGYSDGSKINFAQNFSDWFEPEDFPGEVRALRMAYRVMGTGKQDPRPFYVYAYGFALDGSKSAQSLTLPNDPNIRILAVSLGD